jgi:hypothetical protein
MIYIYRGNVFVVYVKNIGIVGNCITCVIN